MWVGDPGPEDPTHFIVDQNPNIDRVNYGLTMFYIIYLYSHTTLGLLQQEHVALTVTLGLFSLWNISVHPNQGKYIPEIVKYFQHLKKNNRRLFKVKIRWLIWMHGLLFIS
jgi:hypothetical protein